MESVRGHISCTVAQVADDHLLHTFLTYTMEEVVRFVPRGKLCEDRRSSGETDELGEKGDRPTKDADWETDLATAMEVLDDRADVSHHPRDKREIDPPGVDGTLEDVLEPLDAHGEVRIVRQLGGGDRVRLIDEQAGSIPMTMMNSQQASRIE